MSFNSVTCGKCFSNTEFYGRYVPPCHRCGYPELKTREEYMKAMGCTPKVSPTVKETTDQPV